MEKGAGTEAGQWNKGSLLVEVTSFDVVPGSGLDATWGVGRAIRHCRGLSGAVLRFPPGRYEFWPELAAEETFFISNHDNEGRRRVAFPLNGMKDFTVEAAGAEFIFHGLILPFRLEHCENVTLRGFTVDWEVPMMAQGTVLGSGEDWFDLAVEPEYKCRVADGKLLFRGEGWEREVWGLIEYDPATRATAYGSGDQWSYGPFKSMTAEERPEGVIRYRGNASGRAPADGNKIVFRFGKRDHPAIALSGCRGITAEDITVYHALGMGLIAQSCADVRLDRFHVTVRPGSDRLFSAKADATHFVYCSGRLELAGCVLEHQMDDPCNIHGIYGRIAKQLDSATLLVQLVHRQQQGVDIAAAGERVRLVSGKTLLPYGTLTLRSVEVLNAEYMVLAFDGALPDGIRPGDGVENLDRTAEVTIRGCTVRRNRARGFLLTNSGSVVMTDNTISAPGAGIKISGDANFWYESGGARSIVIRNNTFLDCNYAYPSWGKAVIDIDPVIQEPETAGGYYHGEIRIEGNTFRTYERALVRGHSVAKLVFRGNKVEPSDTYPPHGKAVHALDLAAYGAVETDGNRFAGGTGTLRWNGEIRDLATY